MLFVTVLTYTGESIFARNVNSVLASAKVKEKRWERRAGFGGELSSVD